MGKALIPTKLRLLWFLAAVSVTAPAAVLAETLSECFGNVCASIEAPACVAPGAEFEIAVNGTLVDTEGFRVTAFALYRDAEWSYTDRHVVTVDQGTVVDRRGFVLDARYARTYPALAPQGEAVYTFIFGERTFGHGFADAAVDITVNAGGDGVQAPLDIKPSSCPNPVNTASRGILPVAIAGTDALDVTRIDPASVRIAGVAPMHHAFEDVATPYEPLTGKNHALDCTQEGADGRQDLSLKFRTSELIAALESSRSDRLEDGETLRVSARAQLLGGATCDTVVTAEDMIRVIRKGRR